MRSRAALTIAFVCAPIGLLSGCGSSSGDGEGSSATLQYVPGTSYALKQPATTTTTTTLAVGVTPGQGTSLSEQTYQIQSGDSLFKVAGLFDVTPDLICSYNGWPDCIDPPHLLLPGDTILIPPGGAVPGAAADGTADEVDTIDTPDDGAGDGDDAAGCVHTIVAGDNPTRVANKYDVTVDELSNANLNNPVWNTFLVGSTLNIPPNGDC